METGELSIDSLRCQRVTWKISDFLLLPKEERYFVDSPVFHFAGPCFLRLFPNTSATGDKSAVYVLVKVKANVSCNIALQTSSGEEFNLFSRFHQIDDNRGHSSIPVFCFPREELERKRTCVVPNDILTLICYLTEKKNNEGSPESEKADRNSGVVNLQSDYRQLLQNETDSDTFLEVCGKEFRAHRCVLRARSPVFDAMFRHQTAEKESGRVVIEDLDPDCFVHFLEYMYTGVVEADVLNDHAIGLYKAADKYGVPTLKSVCVVHMKRNLSVDSFCDVMTLAKLHSDEDLLQPTVSFFKPNLPRIIVMPQWEQFLIENGKTANELLVKALVPERQ